MQRPFRGLKTGPNTDYDVVVIGAGIGGLISANLLARAGLRVLLAEQHYMVGGYCSTFRRKGFVFDAASHFYPLLGNPDTITGRLLRQLEVASGWIPMDPVDHFHFPDGSRFSVPADYDTYLAQLKDEFPEDSQAIDDFFSMAEKVYGLGLLHYFRSRPVAQLDRYRRLSLREVLERFFRNPKLKLLLTADCPHWGSPPSRISFVFDSMLRLSYFLGNYYPEGGSQSFADALASRFEQSGGHVLMSSRVVRILVERDAVRGVELETGTPRRRLRKSVRAQIVVSNADLIQTVGGMLDNTSLSANYLESIRSLRATYSCFLTHLGVQGIPTEELSRVQGYHWSSWDAEDVATRVFKIFVPTLFEPKMAPAGGHVVILQKLTDVDYKKVSDWKVHKEEVERRLLDSLEEFVPGFRRAVVVKASASAETSRRFTLNHEGAMLGWEMSPDQLGDDRPDNDGPVKNLYFVGHWTKPGGGITPVAVSAMRVANKIIQGREGRETSKEARLEVPGPSFARRTGSTK